MSLLVLLPTTSKVIHGVIGAYKMIAGCGHEAWMSPQGETFLREHPTVETVCVNCAPRTTKVIGIPGIENSFENRTPEQARRQMFLRGIQPYREGDAP